MGFRVGWVSFGWVLIGCVSTGCVDSGYKDSVYLVDDPGRLDGGGRGVVDDPAPRRGFLPSRIFCSEP